MTHDRLISEFLGHKPATSLEWLGETTKYPSQDSRFQGPDSISEPPEYAVLSVPLIFGNDVLGRILGPKEK
jgi:hypothetical protein